jgi:molecular chaperone HscB
MSKITHYFDLFQLPINFQLDQAELAKRYHALQKVVHPDRHTAASATDQRLALQNATQINEAYNILRDPLQRAIYMLSLQGIQISAETATLQDSAFLMQQITLRENLAAIPQQTDPLTALDVLLADISEQIATQIAALTTWFVEPSAPQTACTIVQKLQFLQKVRQEAEAMEAELADLA